MRANPISQQEALLDTKTEDVSWLLRMTWKKGRNESWKFSSNCHIHTSSWVDT